MQQGVDQHIADLIHGAQHEKAFRLLLKEFKQPLYFKLREMLPSHADTDDVLQNTFIKIWKHLPQFEARSKVYSWCYRIAINECLQWLAKLKKHQAVALDQSNMPIASQSAHVYINGSEIQRMLNDAVSTLPPQQQRVFELKYFKEMKYADIAKELKLSPGGLKANYHHAVKKVEAYIKLHAAH